MLTESEEYEKAAWLAFRDKHITTIGKGIDDMLASLEKGEPVETTIPTEHAIGLLREAQHLFNKGDMLKLKDLIDRNLPYLLFLEGNRSGEEVVH